MSDKIERGNEMKTTVIITRSKAEFYDGQDTRGETVDVLAAMYDKFCELEEEALQNAFPDVFFAYQYGQALNRVDIIEGDEGLQEQIEEVIESVFASAMWTI